VELTTEHKIYYSNRAGIPLAEVAEALIALDGILRHSPQVLEKLFPGIKVLDMNIFIDKIESGSLLETILIKFVFGSQEKFEQTLINAREKLQMDRLINNKGVVAAIAAATILTTGIYCVKKDSPSGNKDTKAIEMNNNIIVNVGAGMTQMDPEQFRAVIEASLKGKEDKIAENAIRVVRPAKREPGSIITFDGNQALTLTPEAIAAYPAHRPEPEPEEILENFDGVELSIRATDLDSNKKGWAAVIPLISDKRLRLQIDPSINPYDLIARPKLKANVTVLFRKADNGVKAPRLIYLNEVVTPEDDQTE
jgi:hypothetical protein